MQLGLKQVSGEFELSDPGLDPELFREEFCRVIGLPETIPVSVAIQQLTGGLSNALDENQEAVNYMLAMVAAQKPTSFLEAQLLVQLMSVHRLCTKMIKAASQELWPENIEQYATIAMRLARGYKNGLESLGKYRRDGKQYFYIERVHIEKDAQAIIGNIEGGCI
jgi:hypothetical protein